MKAVTGGPAPPIQHGSPARLSSLGKASHSMCSRSLAVGLRKGVAGIHLPNDNRFSFWTGVSIAVGRGEASTLYSVGGFRSWILEHILRCWSQDTQTSHQHRLRLTALTAGIGRLDPSPRNADSSAGPLGKRQKSLPVGGMRRLVGAPDHVQTKRILISSRNGASPPALARPLYLPSRLVCWRGGATAAEPPRLWKVGQSGERAGIWAVFPFHTAPSQCPSQ